MSVGPQFNALSHSPVAPQRGFDRLMHEAVEFDYADLNWEDDDIKQLASCLAYAHSQGGLQHVKKLNLMRNKMGDAGLGALTQVIRSGAMPKLREKGMQM
eukprot:3326215-Prymnesium_polylepis.1